MSDFVGFNLMRPAWLLRPVGAIYLTVLGLMKQAALEALHEAQKMGRPRSAPSDALSWIARDRGQPPGFEGESDEAIRERAERAFPIARGRGWDTGLLAELARVGYPNASIEDRSDDSALEWWQFRVVLERPFPFDDQHLADETWEVGGPLQPPVSWGDGGLWASAMPAAHLVHLRALVRAGLPTHARCVGIRVKYDATNPLDVVDLDA